MKLEQVSQGFIHLKQDIWDGECGTKPPFLSDVWGLDGDQSVE